MSDRDSSLPFPPTELCTQGFINAGYVSPVCHQDKIQNTKTSIK